MKILKLLQQNSLPCYHPDNKMITGGCTGNGIGMPQRIRVTTWNRTHINYTECVKSERVGIRYALRKATQSLSFSDSIPDCGNDWTTVFMIHKRELSDSMIESVSSLFYLSSFFLSSTTSQSLNFCDGVTFLKHRPSSEQRLALNYPSFLITSFVFSIFLSA